MNLAQRAVRGRAWQARLPGMTQALYSELVPEISLWSGLDRPDPAFASALMRRALNLPHQSAVGADPGDVLVVNDTRVLPAELTGQGVRRYGFHGLSYHYIMDTLLERSAHARGRVLMAHLGNGASLCAARAGRSVATTMGFSALDGLMMGTRSGTLDAGVLLYLMEQGWDHDRIQKLLYPQSGLLGVSGISADMRRLRADGSAAAQRAIDQFIYRVVRESGAMVASIGQEGTDMKVGLSDGRNILTTDIVKWLAI